MSSNGLRLEYALEGTSNLCSCKYNMEVVIDDNGVLDYTQTNIPKLATLNAQQSTNSKYTTKARRVILEGVINHVVSNLHEKETLFEMWKKLTNIFQSSSDVRKLTLRDPA